MPPKVRELNAELRRARFASRPGKGSHTVWEHPLLPGVRVVISGNDGDDARSYQVDAVRDALAKLREVQKRQP